jgi:phosphoglycerate dehydrogenase-like enzyme
MRVLVGPNNWNLEQVIQELAPQYPQAQFAFCADRKNLPSDIAEAEVYFGWLGREEFLAAKKLRWIQSPSSGVDRFLIVPELKEGSVILTSAVGTHGACLAEHALAMLLSFTRGIRGAVMQQQKRHWAIQELRPKVVELTGSTLGIIGFGTVGRALAKRAQTFGLRIIALDAFPGSKPDYVERVDGLPGLEALMREADYVVVTVPLTELTQHMISVKQLAWLKPSAILVAISRGGVVDEMALAQALRDGKLAGAALDVFEQEPLPESSPLWQLDNLLITPHIAGGSQYEAKYIREIFRENFARYVRGQFPLRNQVDKARGF